MTQESMAYHSNERVIFRLPGGSNIMSAAEIIASSHIVSHQLHESICRRIGFHGAGFGD